MILPDERVTWTGFHQNLRCAVYDIFVMLLVGNFFKTFTKNEICDTSKYTEVLLALSADSREKVDQMIKKAIEANGKSTRNSCCHMG